MVGDYILRKDHRGWSAVSTIPMPEIADDRVLIISTMKRVDGYVRATAISAILRDGMTTYLPFNDYASLLRGICSYARATQTNVQMVQNSALQQLDVIKAECITHYARQEEQQRCKRLTELRSSNQLDSQS